MRAVVKRHPTVGMEFTESAPQPVMGADEVLVEVVATSLCGVDRHIWDWDSVGQAFVPELPITPGHETAGVVRAAGQAVRGLEPGTRVALESHLVCHRCLQCRTGNAHLCTDQKILGLSWDGAFAELLRVPASACFPIAAEVSFESAALFEPAGVAVHAVQRARSLVGASALVSGCGPIGLFLIQLLRLCGATTVLAADVNGYRRDLAQQLGAVPIDPAHDDLPAAARSVAPGRDGVDIVFEASGVPAAFEPAIASVRTAGEMIMVGHPGEVTLDSRFVNVRYVTIKGVFGRRLWDSWETLAELVRTRRLDLEQIVTHEVALDEIDRAIELLDGEAGKVLVRPR